MVGTFRSPFSRHHNLLGSTAAPITGPITKGKGGGNTAGKGHGKDQSGGGGVSAPADITLAVQDMVTGTTTGNVDYTTTALTGVTPVAALCFFGQQHISAEPGETNTAQVGIAAVGSSGWSVKNWNWDNAANTAVNSLSRTSAALRMTNQTFNGDDFIGTLSLISGGVRANWTNATTSNRLFYVAFAGANVSAKASSIDLGTTAGTTSVPSVGFEADVVIACLGTTTDNNQQSRYSPVVGVAVNEGGGTIAQRCIATFEANNIATSNAYQAILTGKVGALLDSSGGKTADFAASNFSSSGYDIVRTGNAASQDLMLLALKFTGGGKKLVDFTTPTSTGNHSITGAGFTPRLALVFLTNLEGIDPTFPLTASDLMSGFSVSAVGDETWGMSARVDNLAATTDTATRVKSAVLGANATSTNGIEASLVSFDSDGMTLNYSAVAGTGKKGFILFIE